MGLGSTVHLESVRDEVWNVLFLARMPGEHVLYQLLFICISVEMQYSYFLLILILKLPNFKVIFYYYSCLKKPNGETSNLSNEIVSEYFNIQFCMVLGLI